MKCLVDARYQYMLNWPGWYEKDGYVVRNVKQENGKRTTQRLHVLIFLTEENMSRLPVGMVVHHINEDKLDNRTENLELMSAAHHIAHHHTGKLKPYVAERNKTEWMRSKLRGNRHGEMLAGDANGRSKVTDTQWLDAFAKLFSGEVASNAELARLLGIERTQVGYVLKGLSRKHLQPQILELKQLYGRK